MANGDAENAYHLYLSAIEVDDHAALHVGIAWAEATLDVCDEAADDLGYAVSRKKADPALDDAPTTEAEHAIGECYRRRAEKSEPLDPPFVQDQAE